MKARKKFHVSPAGEKTSAFECGVLPNPKVKSYFILNMIFDSISLGESFKASNKFKPSPSSYITTITNKMYKIIPQNTLGLLLSTSQITKIKNGNTGKIDDAERLAKNKINEAKHSIIDSTNTCVLTHQ